MDSSRSSAILCSSQVLLALVLGTRAEAQNVKLNGPLAQAESGSVLSERLSADGTRGVFAAELPSSTRAQLYSFDLTSTRAPRALATLEPSSNPRYELSPDGQRVVYWDRATRSLFTQSTEGGEPVELVSPSVSGTVVSFQISPDGAWVALRGDLDSQGTFELYLAPSDGSSPTRKLNGNLVADGDVQEFAFRPDSRAVFYLADQRVDGQVELFAAGLGGAQPVRINAPLIPDGDVRSFKVAPDGRSLVYLADQRVNDKNELFGVVLGSTTPVPLSPQLALLGDVFDYSFAGNTRVVYRARRSNSSGTELFSVGVSGSPRRLNGGGNVILFNVSPDGSRVAYVADQEVATRDELYGVPADGRAPAVKLNGPLVPGGDVQNRLSISADSLWLVYTAGFGGAAELFSVRLDGSGTPQRLSASNPDGSEAISPDGRSVLFLESSARLAVVPIDGSAAVRVLHEIADYRFALSSARWATSALALFQEDSQGSGSGLNADRNLLRVPADGSSRAERISRWPLVTVGEVQSFALSGNRVLYVADQEALNRPQVYVTTPTGAALPLRWSDPTDTDLIFQVQFSPDGQRIAALVVHGAEQTLRVGSADGSALPYLIGDDVARFEWARDGQRLVFTRSNSSGQTELASAKADGLTPPALINDTLVSGGSVYGFELSADGRWAVYAADQDVDERIELYRAEMDGSGAAVALAGVQGEEDVLGFQLSPDAAYAVYLVRDASTGIFTLYSTRLSGPFSRTPLASGHLDFAPTNERVVFRIFGGQSSELYSVPIAGGTPILLSGPGSNVIGYGLVAGGARVIYEVSAALPPSQADLFSVLLDGSAAPVRLNPNPIPASSSWYVGTVFRLDPTGRRVAYLGADGLAVADILDGHTLLLDPERRSFVPGDWLRFSPDGTRLVYPRFRGAGIELAHVETDGSRAPRAVHGPLVSGGSVSPWSYEFTPDGKRVVYLADQDEDEVLELYSATLDGPRTLPR
jgi:Tol biopolymer transport system component